MAKNTEEATDAVVVTDIIAPPSRVTVRALVDLQVGDTAVKAGQVTELDADIATDLIDNGLADNNADAIAYVLSL